MGILLYAYLSVHSLAVVLNSARLVSYWRAMSGTSGSLGFGSVSRLLMLIPHNVASWAWWTDVIGVAMALVLVWDQRRRIRGQSG